jgi:hypothetical protein
VSEKEERERDEEDLYGEEDKNLSVLFAYVQDHRMGMDLIGTT